jgi:hypothetical protein
MQMPADVGTVKRDKTFYSPNISSTRDTDANKQFIIGDLRSAAALGGLVVSVLATGPTGLAAAGSGPAEGGGFLWVIKICSAHFLRRGSKAVGPKS